jgi:ketosteroid isomerase-like protein
MVESNVELARRGYEAALQGDLEAVRELLDPDVAWHGGDPSGPQACQDREQALEFMRAARARRPIGELVDVRGAGDKVVLIMRAAGQGHDAEALSANLTTFREGRAVEMVHYDDVDEALAAAGL